jgi:putative tryptophan/tyrosine transport system substrate-binding protein
MTRSPSSFTMLLSRHTRRREFIAGLGGAAAWPLTARGQQSERNDRTRRIGLLLGATEADDPESQTRLAAFRQGLEALGWSESRNIRIDYRFGGGDSNRIQSHVTDLVNSTPDLIVANGSPVLRALKQATHSIPIVFAVVNDPVGQGFVESLARPGGNITGFTLINFEILGKWVELLKQAAPHIRRTTLLFNPVTAPYYGSFLRELGTLSQNLAIEMESTPVQLKLEPAVTAVARNPNSGLIVAADPFMVTNRATIIELAARYQLPAIYEFRQFAVEDGLMSYGPDTADVFRRSASYVDRILKGAEPAELPVQQPVKFELVINLKTAKALTLEVPTTLLARADEVIE